MVNVCMLHWKWIIYDFLMVWQEERIEEEPLNDWLSFVFCFGWATFWKAQQCRGSLLVGGFEIDYWEPCIWRKCVYDAHWHNKTLHRNKVCERRCDGSHPLCIKHKPICLNVGLINKILSSTNLSKLWFRNLCEHKKHFVATNKYFVWTN